VAVIFQREDAWIIAVIPVNPRASVEMKANFSAYSAISAVQCLQDCTGVKY
jgi:hypothetical protein